MRVAGPKIKLPAPSQKPLQQEVVALIAAAGRLQPCGERGVRLRYWKFFMLRVFVSELVALTVDQFRRSGSLVVIGKVERNGWCRSGSRQ